MFEFFTALFGGLYYGNKYSNEKAKEKAYNTEKMSRDNLYNDIRSKYCASAELEAWARELILKGNNFEDICNWFAEDFQYALGSNWKEKLRLPPKPMLHSGLSRNDAYSFSVPANHICWVYHLLLAKKGKISSMTLYNGYMIGGIEEKGMNIKFAECIEKQLIKAGVKGVRLALELDMMFGTRRRTPSDLCGATIKIEALSPHPTHRLW